MKNLNIGDTILRCRKEKGITQEQLSNMVGVSAGAVCKWETGNSFPDIELLSPLARALNISLDELLSFNSKLLEDDVINIKKKLTEVFIQEGYDAGYENCKALLNEYPNSVYLKLTVAELIQMYSMMYANKSEKLFKPKMECALKLLDQIVTSKDAKYMSQALFSIASIQMMLENYDESEKALKELSTSSSIDPMTIYPMLLQRQGKNDEAKVQGENMLLSHIIQSTSMLATIANISISTENYENAQIYIDAIRKIQSLFNVGLHSGDYNLCKLYIKKGQLDCAAKYFKIYVEGVISTEYDYSNNKFFKDVQLEVAAEGQKSVRKKTYQSYIDDSALNVLKGLKDYEEGIRRLKANLY
ncbi:helix-turn-helix domain-containing protein [Clostridium estertheticum]|uniref:helix-turn-helix domain-containing protein n=1 Tax=Clostridium estertheticum TaxID=238834 RepID=UPI001C0C31D8|nr:helix-turn-helix transcriptional regulator [Clostridium estertheticum]MBU3186903.1 helix-turn-helix domain-containing protein [Clostridium estertheticum]